MSVGIAGLGEGCACAGLVAGVGLKGGEFRDGKLPLCGVRFLTDGFERLEYHWS